jgi:hypothetical protein
LSYINRHNRRTGHYCCFPGVDVAVQREAPDDIPEKYMVQLKFENLVFRLKGEQQKLGIEFTYQAELSLAIGVVLSLGSRYGFIGSLPRHRSSFNSIRDSFAAAY